MQRLLGGRACKSAEPSPDGLRHSASKKRADCDVPLFKNGGFVQLRFQKTEGLGQTPSLLKPADGVGFDNRRCTFADLTILERRNSPDP